ncbi:MAG: hypothetical protein O3B42_09555 [Actinomycetota bacterium]|nr:hypothetical protein [Actinomycetota bacterium]
MHLERNTTWWSRLATDGLSQVLGFDPNPEMEIPHVRGLPVLIDRPRESVQVREWPNTAGRLEPVRSTDLVRWDRSLAPEPPTGTVLPYGESPDPAFLREASLWFTKFVRSLEQVSGIMRAAPSETPRAVVLTPSNLIGRIDCPEGLVPVPRRLGEFPGGAIVTMYPSQWDHRTAYAGNIKEWLTSTVTTMRIR